MIKEDLDKINLDRFLSIIKIESFKISDINKLNRLRDDLGGLKQAYKLLGYQKEITEINELDYKINKKIRKNDSRIEKLKGIINELKVYDLEITKINPDSFPRILKVYKLSKIRKKVFQYERECNFDDLGDLVKQKNDLIANLKYNLEQKIAPILYALKYQLSYVKDELNDRSPFSLERRKKILRNVYTYYRLLGESAMVVDFLRRENKAMMKESKKQEKNIILENKVANYSRGNLTSPFSSPPWNNSYLINDKLTDGCERYSN